MKRISIRTKDIITTIVFVIVAAMLVFACWWAWNQFKHTPPYVDEEKYPIRGIDVSAHNGEIDFKKVKNAGMEFVFIKATEGATFKDKKFEQNYRQAVEAGLMTGAYHFFRYDVDGIEQAKNLCKSVADKPIPLGVAIDVENHGNPSGINPLLIRERLSAMVDYLILKGYKILFYSNKDGYYDHLFEAFHGFPLWICSFSEHPINAEWTFWQFNHKGRVAGISGNVDINAFGGNREEWSRYINYTD